MFGSLKGRGREEKGREGNPHLVACVDVVKPFNFGELKKGQKCAFEGLENPPNTSPPF